MLLETTTYSINEISKIVGYDNQLYFSRLFHKWKGYSPREYRKLRNKFWNPQRGVEGADFQKTHGVSAFADALLLYTICVLPRVCYVEKNRAIVEHSEPR